MGEYAELEYFCQAASTVATQGARGASQSLANKIKPAATRNTEDDFIGLDN